MFDNTTVVFLKIFPVYYSCALCSGTRPPPLSPHAAQYPNVTALKLFYCLLRRNGMRIHARSIVSVVSQNLRFDGDFLQPQQKSFE